MVLKISPQTTTLTGQNATDALPRDKSASKPAESTSLNTKSQPGASYELNLSEKAPSFMSSPLPNIITASDAQTQLNLIKSSAQESPGTTVNLQKPNVKSVIDLLA